MGAVGVWAGARSGRQAAKRHVFKAARMACCFIAKVYQSSHMDADEAAHITKGWKWVPEL
jgi:hypothetical protein